MTKKFLVAAGLIALLAFLIPIEHKYDKLFRFFSLSLIPDDLTLSPHFEKKIYFFVTDLIALALLFLGIKNRRFFTHPLWIIPICALLSILASPFIHYPVAYIRLLQLFTPIILFSFLATSFTPEERSKVTKWVLLALLIGGLFQSGVGIAQYFKQGPLGLRILGEVRDFSTIEVQGGARFLFDSSTDISKILIRATGTMQHANVFGGFLTLTLLSTYALLLLVPKYRWLFVLAIPIQFFALTLSYSRSALFAWAIGTAIWLGLLTYKIGIKNRLIQQIILLVSASFLISGALLYNQYAQRGGVVSTTVLNKSSDKIRAFHQGLALQILKEHPFTGLGYGQFSERASDYFPPNTDDYVRATAPHNIYLFLACETGIISLAAFLLTIALLIWSVLRSPLTIEIITCTSLLFAFLFIGLCDFYPILFQPGKLMFFLIAGLLAAHTNKTPTKEETMNNDPSRQDVWKMFDIISPTYDRINKILSFGMDRKWRKKVSEYLPEHKNLKILDLATGTGDQALALLNSKASIRSVTGIDLSTEMLEIAKTKVPANVELIRADAEKLPFAPASFDAATFSFGIRNVNSPITSLLAIHRVLKAKGRCLILEFSLPPQPIRPFFLFYLRHILPRIGGLLSRKPTAYRYLNQTIEHFPSGKDFCLMMKEAGFTRIRAIPMALGGVTLYVGDKP